MGGWDSEFVAVFNVFACIDDSHESRVWVGLLLKRLGTTLGVGGFPGVACGCWSSWRVDII